MFYDFSKLTQSLVSSSQDVAVGRPITPQAFTTSLKETSQIHYEFKPLSAPEGSLSSIRQASSSAALNLGHGQYPVPNTKGYKRLMELQSKFLAPDGRLVWQKTPTDRMLYYAVIGLASFGLLMSLGALKAFIAPPKNQ